MNYLLVQINKYKLFFACLGSLLIAASVWLLVIGKAGTFLALNAWHSPWLNTFFINYTYIGDGIFAVLVAALCFFIPGKRQLAVTLLFAYLFSGLVAQIVKHLVESPRPRLFFKPGEYSNFIEEISLTGNASFPSGHTTTAFAMAVVLVLSSKNKNWQLPILAAAVLVGYSRIYLGNHFLGDALMGAFIGGFCGLVSVWIIDTARPFKKLFRKDRLV